MAPLKSSDGRTTGKLISLWMTNILGQGISVPFSATGGTTYEGPNSMKYAALCCQDQFTILRTVVISW